MRPTYTPRVRLMRTFVSVCLILAGGAVIPTSASALTCARPQGSELEVARKALTGAFGAGSFDGFLIARVLTVDHGPSGDVSDLELAVAVGFEADVGRDVHLGVGPHGPLTGIEPGRTYFLTLSKSTDSELPPLFVHPCGPAFELSSTAELDTLLSAKTDETVVDDVLLAEMRRDLSSTGWEVPVLLIVLIAGAILMLSMRRRGAPWPEVSGSSPGQPP